MTSESCCNCAGTGKVTISWDFGHAEADCSYCSGTGEIGKGTLYRSLEGLISKHYKEQITTNLFAKSPMLELLERKVAEAEAQMSEQLNKTLFAQEYPPSTSSTLKNVTAL